MDPISLSKSFEFDVYPKRDVVLVRGRGASVWDADGRAYLDCAAGHGVANLGHCNDAIAEAIAAQARTLVTCPGTYHNDVRSRLYERLASIAPTGLTRSFLCNSGTEAVEAALKFARAATGRTDFVCAIKGFHGRTFGAMSATHNPEYKEGFAPLLPGFTFVPFNRIEPLREAITSATAGVILEVVQGEGGVHVGDADYFGAVRKLCDDRGALLIVDEIQTGFCRTGRMFACQHFGLSPDLMCVAKSLAGGLPIGAVLCSERVPPPTGRHGSTFGGNPLCCAAALAATDYMIAHRLDEQAAQKGEYLVSRLRERKFGRVREVRGLGLMVGLELREKVKPLLLQLLERGLIALPAGGTVLRLLPPLTISYAELDLAIEKLSAVLDAG